MNLWGEWRRYVNSARLCRFHLVVITICTGKNGVCMSTQLEHAHIPVAPWCIQHWRELEAYVSKYWVNLYGSKDMQDHAEYGMCSTSKPHLLICIFVAMFVSMWTMSLACRNVHSTIA